MKTLNTKSGIFTQSMCIELKKNISDIGTLSYLFNIKYISDRENESVIFAS